MTKKSDTPNIVLYRDWGKFFLGVDMVDAGYLIQTIYNEALEDGKTITTDNSVLKSIANFMVEQIKKEHLTYKEKCDNLANNFKSKRNTNGDQMETVCNPNGENNKNKNKNKNNNKNNNTFSSIEEKEDEEDFLMGLGEEI